MSDKLTTTIFAIGLGFLIGGDLVSDRELRRQKNEIIALQKNFGTFQRQLLAFEVSMNSMCTNDISLLEQLAQQRTNVHKFTIEIPIPDNLFEPQPAKQQRPDVEL